MKIHIITSGCPMYPLHIGYVKSNDNFLAYFIFIDMMVEENQDHFLKNQFYLLRIVDSIFQILSIRWH